MYMCQLIQHVQSHRPLHRPPPSPRPGPHGARASCWPAPSVAASSIASATAASPIRRRVVPGRRPPRGRVRAGAPNVVLLVTADEGDVDAAAVTAAAGADPGAGRLPPGRRRDLVLVARLRRRRCAARTGARALVVGRLRGDEDEWQDVADGLVEEFNGDAGRRSPSSRRRGGRDLPPGRRHHREGPAPGPRASPCRSPSSCWSSSSAASSPPGCRSRVGVLAIVGTFLVLWLITLFTDVSVFSHQPGDRHGPRPGHRLQPVRRLPLPRGARAPAATVDDGRRAHGRRPPAARSPFSALTVGRLARRPCSSSRSTSCARSPTPGIGVDRRRRAGRAASCLPALLAVARHRGSTSCACPRSRREPAGRRGLLAPGRRRR